MLKFILITPTNEVWKGVYHVFRNQLVRLSVQLNIQDITFVPLNLS